MLDPAQISDEHQPLSRDGYLIASDVLSSGQCDRLLGSLAELNARSSRRRGGIRNLFEVAPVVRELAAAPELRRLVDDALSPSARAVRAILFDKTPESNWQVAWHQDVTIAVSHRIENLPGFGPWSMKTGITHVQPPAAVLQRMITLRLHLDACGPENGPLQVMPGSHRHGVTSRPLEESDLRVCPVPRGGVLVMRPLLWHASSKADVPGHRRVVHIEYADTELPAPLCWHERY